MKLASIDLSGGDAKVVTRDATPEEVAEVTSYEAPVSEAKITVEEFLEVAKGKGGRIPSKDEILESRSAKK